MNIKSKFKNSVHGWWFTLAIMTTVLVGGGFKAHAFVHPCIPTTLQELDTIKANLDKEPWKSGFMSLSNASTSHLEWHMEGPCDNVSRTPDINLTTWKNDMNAIYNLARMWYFTGNEAYAQKAHDILLAWATTHTRFSGQEMSLSVGDFAPVYAEGADILRATWPGWTEADTTTVKNYFRNVYWPQTLGDFTTTGPANKGYLNMAAGIAIATFLDDTNKFNRIIDIFRTTPAAGLYNTLPIGVMGETGRDAGHLYGGLISATFFAEVAWKQGIDLYSELDNRLLACGEYYARNTFVWDNPYVPFGTIDWNYAANNPYTATVNRGAFFILQNAYKNRLGLPTPWIDHKMTEQGIDGGNFMYAKTADFSTATPLPPIVRPSVSPASSGLTLTTLGGQTAGRSVAYAGGVWTMSGLGSGTWTDGADDCQFAYRAVSGDCAMVAKVTSATWSGNGNGKVGLMIRDNLVGTVSQRHWIGIVPNPASPLMEAHVRGWTEIWGGSNRSVRSAGLPSGSLPYWVKIERRGNLITSYTSQDGASWSPWLAGYFANMPATINMGLFVCSGNTTVTTATFEHVAFTDGTGGLVAIPDAPAGLLSIGSSKVVTLRWLQSYGATAYDLLRSTNSGSGYTAIASDLGTDKTSYVDTNVTAGITYYYVVRAKNSAGTSDNSPEFYATLLPAPLADIAIGGTASDNDNSTPPNAANAFDHNPGTLWFHQGATGWLQYDLGAGNAQVVKCYTFSPADVFIPARDPKDWEFLGSNDGTTWTPLDTQTNQSFAIRMQLLTYNLTNTTAYRYYRFNITANNGDAGLLQVGEIGLWNDSGRTIPDGNYRLFNRKSNKLMHVGAATNGTPVVQQTFDGDNSQLWSIAWQGNGQYRATNVSSAKVLDNGGSSNAGDNLVIQPSSGGNSQLWSILPDRDGFFRITSANSGLVADVSGGSTADDANIIQGAYNGGDSQLWMPGVASDPQPIPSTPTGLGATAASLSQINLSWTASPGAMSYNIKRAIVSGGPYTTIAESVNTTNYASTGLLSATTYYYVVSAVNGSGVSADSAQASATTLAAPPAAPTGLNAILGQNQVTLSWMPSAAATSYNVRRAITSGGPYTIVASGVTSTNYTNTGLTNGVTYYYVVSASNTIGTGPDSTEVSVTPSTLVVQLKFDETGGTTAADSSGRAFHATLVNGPTFGVGMFGNSLVLVTNSYAVAKYVRLPNGVTSGLTNFTVSTWVQMNSFETWQRIFDFGTGTGNYMFLSTQYTPTAPNNAKLRFGIRTTTAAEQIVSSTIALPTNAWTHVAVTRSGNTVTLYVNGTNAGSGTITLNPSDLGVTTLNYLGKSQWADPYLDGNLDDFRLYSQAMSAGEIAALANPAAGVPLQFAVVPGYGQATLTWLPNATTTYTVKRSTTSGGNYTPVATGLTNLTYTDTGLTNGVTYYYVVSGANSGGSGPNSAEVSVTPSDLGLHLKFDETNGAIATDSSFRAYNATLVNGPIFTTGEISNALTLGTSSSQYATLPTGVLDGLTNCTIMAWVKLNTVATWQRIFDFGSGTTSYMFLTTQYDPNANADKLRFSIRTPAVPETAANQLSSSVTTPIGSWAHVAVVLSGSTGRLYLNGSQVAISTTMTLNPSSLGSTTLNYLGKSQFGSDPYLNGSLDDLRIYNRALTAGEIAMFQTPLVAPNGLEATPGNAQVQLMWNAVANATSYTLSRSGNSGGPFTAIAQLSSTNFMDTNVVNGGTYYYVVRAANFTGESPDSLPVSAQLVSLEPPNLSFTVSGGELQFSWPGDHTGWRLQMNTNLGTTNWLDVVGSDAANYISIPATNGNAYFRLVYP